MRKDEEGYTLCQIGSTADGVAAASLGSTALTASELGAEGKAFETSSSIGSG